MSNNFLIHYRFSIAPSTEDTSSDCRSLCNAESLIVSDSGKEILRLCIDRNTSSKQMELVVNSTTHEVTVVYSKAKGQLSNPDPSWIYYRFWRVSRVRDHQSRVTTTGTMMIMMMIKMLNFWNYFRVYPVKLNPSGWLIVASLSTIHWSLI